MHEEERNRRVIRYELGKRLLELRDGDVEAMVEALATPFEGNLVADVIVAARHWSTDQTSSSR
ncbi:hypothetical protein [Natrinema soli]|uniref:Uncharacterized protein n=1 Tax=Natrinema soli TaxID=1930624 RepID=A0ABD5SKA0_9EURY|nr:hypothetical protein [Natrinema soli]